MTHPLDGSQTPDAEDFAERVAIVMEGERVDQATAERIVFAQRAEASQRKVKAQQELFA